MTNKLKYSELESENVELKKALANMTLLFDTVNELYKGEVKLVAFMAKEVDDFELLKL